MPASTEVLKVGAGPSGLFAAIERARQGVQARVVEREPGPHTQARATAVQPGTLVRPDGHIGFRSPAHSAGLGALDAHLDSYLIPADG